jgi:hypothetical protein
MAKKPTKARVSAWMSDCERAESTEYCESIEELDGFPFNLQNLDVQDLPAPTHQKTFRTANPAVGFTTPYFTPMAMQHDSNPHVTIWDDNDRKQGRKGFFTFRGNDQSKQ